MYTIRGATAADAGALARHRAEMFRDMGQLPDDLYDTLVDATRAYTERAWRRRGVAAALMRELLQWCRANGIESVVLHASGEGRPLYAKLGFTPTNEMRYEGTL